MTRILSFYNPPTMPPAEAARRYGAVVYHRDARAHVEQLRALGWAGEAWCYLLSHQTTINNAVPNKNTLGGIFCDVPALPESAYLHNGAGQRLYEGHYTGQRLYLMNPADAAWRAWAFPRFVQAMQGEGRFGGLFLDNVGLHIHHPQRNQANADGKILEFGNGDAAYRAASLQYTRDLCAHVKAKIPGLPITGNLITSYDADAEFRPFLEVLDGALYEYMVGRWSNGLVPADLYGRQLAWAEAATAAGKRFLWVSQGGESDAARFRYCFVSYKLVESPLTAFAYTRSDLYGNAWWFPEYDLDLGEPLGPRYQDGARWRRDFERGSVSADPTTATGEIVATPPPPPSKDDRLDRARALAEQLLAVLGEPAPV